MKALWDSFIAFNVNGWSHLVYTVTDNLWYILITVGALVCVTLYLREEIAVTVREEQQAL